MAEAIVFRASLGQLDWDARVRAFRCSAVAIPGARVDSVRTDSGRELAPSEYAVRLAEREISITVEGPAPAGVLVTIVVPRALTTRSSATAYTSLAGVATALVTAVAGYFTAVEPARITAATRAHELSAEVETASRELKACRGELAANTKPRDAASGRDITATTTGAASPVTIGPAQVTVSAEGD